MKNTISMTQFAATIANCLDIPAPAEAAPAFPFVKEMLEKKGIERAEKLLIYNPDAMGLWLYQKYTERFAPVVRHTECAVPVCSVMPSVTPVNFGTMYTGVMPERHGITKYQKKLIENESLFDCLAKSDLRTALVAVLNSSMAVIFEGRGIDYYIEPYDGEATDRAEELIRSGKYDVVIVYNEEYDDAMHATQPESERALAAMQHHIAAFDRLCNAVEDSWKGYDRMVCWATDHGIHTNAEGFGTHGEDIEEDMNVLHFFGAKNKE